MNKINKNLICTALVLLVLCNCSEPEKKENVLLRHKTVDLGEDYIGKGGFLAMCGDVVTGLETSPSLPPFYCLRLNGTENTFYRFGSRGQGPDDFLYPFSIQFIGNGYLGAMDMNTKTYCEFRIPDENEAIKIDKKVSFDLIPASRIIQTAYNQYIGLSMQDGLLVMTDSAGNLIKSFFEYPYHNKEERSVENSHRAMGYQGTLTANPSRTKCLYASFYGEILRFYSIDSNGVRSVADIEKEYPLYLYKEDEISSGVTMDVKTRLGYISTYATEQFVYALFSGDKLQELVDRKDYSFDAKTLKIFDWNGKFVKAYDLDIPCSYICVSDNDSRLWAVGADPDMSLVYFDLQHMSDSSEAPPVAALPETEEESADDSQSTDDNQAAGTNSTDNINNINFGKIPVGKTKESTLVFNSSNSLNIISATASSKDIVIKTSGQSGLSVSITKTKPGIFNDTISILLDTDTSPMSIICTGEAY